MIVPPTLTQALQAIGNAKLMVGDAMTVAGLAALGQKEGEMSFAINEVYNDLTATEQTGPAVHQRTLMGVSVTITIPIILGDPLLYATISPTGTQGGGWSNPQNVVTTSVLLIPDQELAGGLAYDGTAWTRTAGNGHAGASGAAAAPKHAIWLWRASPTREGWGFTYENGGKLITNVVYTSFFDAARPEGHKVYTIGDPVAQGIATVRL